MDTEILRKLKSIFELYSSVGLVYIFGSRVKGKTGPLSDYDFAVYLDERDHKIRFDCRLKLIDELSRQLKTEKVDVCVLNDIKSPELKYNIIKDGKIIFEKEPFKLLVEPCILNDYFDFHHLLVKNNLTKI